MKKGGHLNALLVEILIAVLFFALSATVILETFATSRSQTSRAGLVNAAMGAGQDLAERLYAAVDAGGLLEEEGFAFGGDAWEKDFGEYRMRVQIDGEPTAAGMLRRMEVSALEGDESLFALPCSRYFPEEAAQ